MEKYKTRCKECGKKRTLTISPHLDNGNYPFRYKCVTLGCINNDLGLWCRTKKKADKLWKLNNNLKTKKEELAEFTKNNVYLEMQFGRNFKERLHASVSGIGLI